MMNAFSLDCFEKYGLESGNLDYIEKLKAFNKAFDSSVKPNNGFYGTEIIERDNGVKIKVSRNEFGQVSKDYFRDGKLLQNKLKIADGQWEKTLFDDNSQPYLTEYSKFGKSSPREFKSQLASNLRIEKGNFTAITDSYGRPVLNEMKNVQLREGNRQSLNITRTSEYQPGYERGHIIADSFGGPSTAENIIPQLKDVNRGEFKDLEAIVRKLKQDNPDRVVDYKVKTNYSGQSKCPSSFEPEVFLDNQEITLPKEFKKIYNDTELSKYDKIKISAKEGVEKIRPVHDSGKEMGKNAAMITLAISTVDNVGMLSRGEISAEEMVIDIAKETGVAGVIGYGTGFISSAVSKQMLKSGHELIKSLGNPAISTAAVSFGISSFDSINNFAQGNIDMKELCFDLSENAVGIAGSVEGAKYGAAAGLAIAGAPGAAVGGMVGSMVGYAITTEAYATVVEVGGEGVHYLVDKAQELASSTYESAKEILPEKADSIKTSMMEYAAKVGLPVSL